MLDALMWLATNIALGFYNLAYAVTHPALWLDWSNSESLMRFIYYGASIELLFVLFDIFLVVTIIGLIRPGFMWGAVRVLEGIGNGIGRFAAWFGLLMVLQQIMVVFLQGIFRLGYINISPFGLGFTQSVGWFSEELKFYNAIIVSLCVAYAFVQGSHVRVDLFYAVAKYRTKKIIDMIGAVLFMIPFAVLTWLYGWFFLWRHLVVPNPSASDTLDRLLMKARAVRWNVETTSFSPSGFNGYFLFKVLLCAFCLMVILQAVAVLYRSWMELREGPESENKYLDKDSLGEGEEAYEGTH